MCIRDRYNLNHDPSENFNAADQYPDIVKQLTENVAQHLESVAYVPSQLDTLQPQFIAEFKKYNPNFFED